LHCFLFFFPTFNPTQCSECPSLFRNPRERHLFSFSPLPPCFTCSSDFSLQNSSQPFLASLWNFHPLVFARLVLPLRPSPEMSVFDLTMRAPLLVLIPRLSSAPQGLSFCFLKLGVTVFRRSVPPAQLVWSRPVSLFDTRLFPSSGGSPLRLRILNYLNIWLLLAPDPFSSMASVETCSPFTP